MKDYVESYDDLSWFQKLKCRLNNTFGCFAPMGLAYKIFNKLAGKLSCMCCIFWRGLFIGFAFGASISLIFYVI